ncbi:hypothetical protein KM043_003557 [Ampulex compressa]|nr:hypothetical protein KM043_003557 [Ampulex compressa]
MKKKKARAGRKVDGPRQEKKGSREANLRGWAGPNSVSQQGIEEGEYELPLWESPVHQQQFRIMTGRMPRSRHSPSLGYQLKLTRALLAASSTVGPLAEHPNPSNIQPEPRRKLTSDLIFTIDTRRRTPANRWIHNQSRTVLTACKYSSNVVKNRFAGFPKVPISF